MAMIQMGMYVNGKNRPDYVQRHCDHAYNTIAENSTSSEWAYAGRKVYNLCKMDPYLWLVNLIQTETHRNEFYAMDPGAGDFQAGEHLCELLNATLGLRDGVTIHMVNTRAESSPSVDEVQKIGRCILYRLGNFKLEDIEEAFENRTAIVRNCLGDLNRKVDLIFSRYTLQHLADPVAFTVKLYNFYLRLGGLLCADGFDFLGETESVREYSKPGSTFRLIKLLIVTKAPFLIKPSSNLYNPSKYSLFILERNSEADLELPIEYLGIQNNQGDALLGGSGCVVRFKLNDFNSKFLNTMKEHGCKNKMRLPDCKKTNTTIYGSNLELYQKIAKNNPEFSKQEYQDIFKAMIVELPACESL